MYNHVVFIGPRGAGKGMLVSAMTQACPEIQRIVSHTTRPMRSGERDGEQYRFISHETFSRMIERHEFAGWQKISETQTSGMTKYEALVTTRGITDVTFHVANGLERFLKSKGGQLLRIGVWAPRDLRWSRVRARQPLLAREEVDAAMLADINPQEFRRYADLDHVIVNDHPSDPGPAITQALSTIRAFLDRS